MIPRQPHLLETLARLEALVGALEEGQPVRHLLEDRIERAIAICAMPVPEDLTAVQVALQDLLCDPSSRHLPRLRAAFQEALDSAPGDGPTPSARANELMAMALAALDDPEVQFGIAANAFSEELAALATLVAISAGSPEASSQVREEAQQVLELVDKARESLLWIEEAVEGGLRDEALQGVDALVRAIRLMASSKRALDKMIEQEATVPCIRCGHHNTAGRGTCEACRATLPSVERIDQSTLDIRLGEQGPAPETQMTENLARLLEACERFNFKTMTREAFLAEVAWMEGLLEQAGRMGLQDGALEGLEEFKAGLQSLRRAGETGDSALIYEGRKLVWEGSGRMQAAVG